MIDELPVRGQRLRPGREPALQGAGHPPLEVGGHTALRDSAQANAFI